MNRILITGEKSKLGVAFQNYMTEKYPDGDYAIESVSVRGESWKQRDFSTYDVILHCAGIFNAPTQDYKYYEEINVNLTEDLAKKAVSSGVKQFIYLSTMDIYSQGEITKDTIPNPTSLYGKSKLEAEKRLNDVLGESGVKLAIIRCCPVIGKNAESKMEGYVKAFRLPVFPLMFLNDKRSILHVDTLCELIKMIIDNNSDGVFFPQNLQPLSVAEILKIIKRETGKKTILLKMPKLLWLNILGVKKIYESSYYLPELSNHFENRYIKMNSKEAIESIF